MRKYDKEFRETHPETIGETDSHFDLSNYADWLENRIEQIERKAWECSGHKNEAIELLERVCQDLESVEYADGQVTFEEVSCFLIKVQDPEVFKNDLTDHE